MSGARPVVVNGRFLSQRLSGVQRYAREITTALDRLVADDPQGLGARRWRLAVPPDAADRLNLRAIETVVAGRLTGHAWEQLDLPRAARGARLVNLCNAGPLLQRRSIVVIHDAAVYRTPGNFGARYGALHRTLGRLVALGARLGTTQLGTVSRFSQGELADVFALPPASIFVAGNGCDHLVDRPRSADVLDRLGLAPRRYFLFVGSPTPNKNLGVALDAFARMRSTTGHADVRFIVAGSLNKAVFGDMPPDAMPGVVVASGLDDADIAGLYASAAAHVFPTRYEGFGIPPLEAMACGCPVLASDIPPVREVCADAVRYFGPDDPDRLAQLMAAELNRAALDPRIIDRATARVEHYTWARAAQALAASIIAGG